MEGAVLAQKPAMVKTLLDFGASVACEDGTSQPLLKAITTGQAEITTIILDFGAKFGVKSVAPIEYGCSKYIEDALYRDHALASLEVEKWCARQRP